MNVQARRGLAAVTATLALGLLVGCGDDDDDDAADGGSGGNATTEIPEPCLSQEDASQTMQLTATFIPSTVRNENGTVFCAYDLAEATGVPIGFLEIAVAPRADGDAIFNQIRDRARTVTGKDPAPIDVGENGFSAGSRDASYAATIAGDRIVAISASSAQTGSFLEDRAPQLVEVLRKVAG